MKEREQTKNPLFHALQDLCQWWDTGSVRGIVIGGIAVSFLGIPRTTVDIDGMVIIEDMPVDDFLAQGASFGFAPRRTDVLQFARKNRMMLLCHENTGIEIDISLGCLPFEYECIERRVTKELHGFPLPLPTIEDLVIMKSVAHRGMDLRDIEMLIEANPHADKRRILRWVKEFSEVLETPEILKDVDSILKRTRRARKL
jgi:hypothetical protein